MTSVLLRSVLMLFALMLLAAPALAHGAYLEVRNRTHDKADVYCDGDYLGTVNPGHDKTFNCSSGDITVRAQTDNGSSWGPREFHTHAGKTQVWTLVDSNGDSHEHEDH